MGLAVGNPFNLESTVTAGIVSAKGRNIDILEGEYKIESFIQTDAAVNPGNSGGALVNTKGQLVGINTAIITHSGRYEGYSFAIPSNLVQKIISDLKDHGAVQRAILGVSIDEVNNENAKTLNLPNLDGVLIKRINPNGGANEAGLLQNDVIIAINDKKIKSVPSLQEVIGRFRPGDNILITYIRKGQKYETRVNLKTQLNQSVNVLMEDYEYGKSIGFELRDMTSEEILNLGVKGVYVVKVLPNSKIQRTKMDPGYIITKVNEVPVQTISQTINTIKKAKDKILLEGFYVDYPGEYYYSFKK